MTEKITYGAWIGGFLMGVARATGRVAKDAFFDVSEMAAVLSGAALLVAFGFGADALINDGRYTGFNPTWEDLKEWVDKNLAHNPAS